MRNFKKMILVLILAICVCGLPTANAKSVNAELKDLQKQIDDLSHKIDNMKFKKSVLTGLSLSGRVFLTFDYSDNDYDDNKKHNVENERTEVKISKTFDYGKYVVTLKKGNGNSIKFKDVGFYYNMTDKMTLAIGYLALPYSMEDDMNEGTRIRIGTSTYWFDTEAGVLGDGAGVGAYISYLDDIAGIHFGIVGNDLDDSEEGAVVSMPTNDPATPNTDVYYSGKSQMTISTRAYYTPYLKEDSALMLGLTGFYRKFGAGYEQRPDTALAPAVYYANSFTKYSGELMFYHKNFALLAEYIRGTAQVTNRALELYKKNYDLTDYYIQASYVLTGEKYNYGTGYFDSYTVAKPTNEGGYGSFEIFTGYYVDDFDDGERDMNIGSKKDIITAGLNWSPLNQLRLFFTYNYVKEKDGAVNEVGETEDNKYNEYKISARMFF